MWQHRHSKGLFKELLNGPELASFRQVLDNAQPGWFHYNSCSFLPACSLMSIIQFLFPAGDLEKLFPPYAGKGNKAGRKRVAQLIGEQIGAAQKKLANHRFLPKIMAFRMR